MTILNVPYRSQLPVKPGADGSYGKGDCGPTVAASILDALRIPATIDDLGRKMGKPEGYTSSQLRELQTVMGEYDVDLGWHKFTTANGTLDWKAVSDMVNRGSPIIALIWYPLLPLRYDLRYTYGHYVLILGNTETQVVYHDPYWKGEAGAYLKAGKAEFAKAWLATGIHAKTPAQGLYLTNRSVAETDDSKAWATKIETMRWHSEEAQRENEMGNFDASRLRIAHHITPHLYELERALKSGAIRIAKG